FILLFSPQLPQPPRSTLFPYTTLFRSQQMERKYGLRCANVFHAGDGNLHPLILFDANDADQLQRAERFGADILETSVAMGGTITDRKSTRLNSSHVAISYAVFCLKKKT